MIGLILRDQYGIPLVKPIVGKRITQILKRSDLTPSIPEDLDAMLKKANKLRKHLEKNRQDSYNKRSLTLVESKIHRMSDYYKNRGILPKNWKYVPAVASVV
jgi:small subunit ribosomal protein S15